MTIVPLYLFAPNITHMKDELVLHSSLLHLRTAPHRPLPRCSSPALLPCYRRSLLHLIPRHHCPNYYSISFPCCSSSNFGQNLLKLVEMHGTVDPNWMKLSQISHAYMNDFL